MARKRYKQQDEEVDTKKDGVDTYEDDDKDSIVDDFEDLDNDDEEDLTSHLRKKKDGDEGKDDWYVTDEDEGEQVIGNKHTLMLSDEDDDDALDKVIEDYAGVDALPPDKSNDDK